VTDRKFSKSIFNQEDDTMNKFSLFTAIIMTVLVTSYSAHSEAKPDQYNEHRFAHYDGKHRGEMKTKRIMRHLSLLDLTDHQREKIESVIKNAVGAAKPKREEMKRLHAQLKELKKSGKIDEQAIRALASEIASHKSDLFIMHLNKRKEVAALLTPEQLVRLERIKAARREKH